MGADQQEIPLRARGDEGLEISWFIDGKFLGSRKTTEPLWWRPQAGEHRILVLDATGRQASKRLRVR